MMAFRSGWCLLPTMVLALAITAAPAAVAAPAGDCQPMLDAARVLKRLNELRASARSCGSRDMPAVAALRWDLRLAASSRSFAFELAARDQLSHEGRGAVGLRERLRLGGYRLRQGGETLSAGPETLEQVLDQWLASPEHCENLMAAEFTDAGLSCAASPGRYGHFWVLHLGQELPEW